MSQTNNAKWGCLYCPASLYGNGTEKELQEAIVKHVKEKHPEFISPVSNR